MRKKTIVTIVAGIAILALAVAPAIAFYSARTEKVKNQFSIIEGYREEDNGIIFDDAWEDTLAEGLVPGMSVPTEPVLKSHASYSALGYLGVTIPQVEASKSGENTMDPQDSIELVNISDSWRHVCTIPPLEEYPKVEVYCYSSPIEAEESTDPLLKSIQIPDFEKCDGFESTMDVTGYLVQSKGITQETADADAKAYFEKVFQSDYKPPKP